jgi:hypothetical protein
MRTQVASAERDTVLALLGDSVRESIADHKRILDLLLQADTDVPLELGQLFEEAGNAYKAMSESISRKSLLARSRDIE